MSITYSNTARCYGMDRTNSTISPGFFFATATLKCVFRTQLLIYCTNFRAQKTIRKPKTWPFQIWTFLWVPPSLAGENDYLYQVVSEAVSRFFSRGFIPGVEFFFALVTQVTKSCKQNTMGFRSELNYLSLKEGCISACYLASPQGG